MKSFPLRLVTFALSRGSALSVIYFVRKGVVNSQHLPYLLHSERRAYSRPFGLLAVFFIRESLVHREVLLAVEESHEAVFVLRRCGVHL